MFQPFQKTNRSAFLNFLRSKYEMYTGKLHVQSYPYYLTLEPSDKCQLRCPTCVTGIENESRIRHGDNPFIARDNRYKLSHDLLDALLDEMGEYIFLIVFYNFGEPLLHKDLPNIIRKVKAYNIETDINTNLSLPLSDERIEDLLTSGIDYISASIDGFSQETYQIHRVGGDFELAKSNLEKLAKARDRLKLKTIITFNFLVFSHNEHEVSAAQQYSKELGIHFNGREAFIHDPTWLPSHRKHEAPLPVPEEAQLPPEFSYRDHGKTLAWSPLPRVQESKPPRCSWHYGYTAISAGGQVTPCCAVPNQKNDFGTFGTQSFSAIWNNSYFRKSRSDFSPEELPELTHLETVCTQCPVDKFIHHMYSLHDFRVIAQFNQVLGDLDPVLKQAFELLCQSRYKTSIQELFPDGAFQVPARLFGPEEDQDIAKFVQFYEKAWAQEDPDTTLATSISNSLSY